MDQVVLCSLLHVQQESQTHGLVSTGQAVTVTEELIFFYFKLNLNFQLAISHLNVATTMDTTGPELSS